MSVNAVKCLIVVYYSVLRFVKVKIKQHNVHCVDIKNDTYWQTKKIKMPHNDK